MTVGGFIVDAVGETGRTGESGNWSSTALVGFVVRMDAVLTDMTDGERMTGEGRGEGRFEEDAEEDGAGAGDDKDGDGDGAGAVSRSGLPLGSLLLETAEEVGVMYSNAVSIFELLGESVSAPSRMSDRAGLKGEMVGKSGIDGMADKSKVDLSVVVVLSAYNDR